MKMELIFAIASHLDVPNEHITITKVNSGLVWFHVKNGPANQDYWCKMTKRERLKTGSIRLETFN